MSKKTDHGLEQMCIVSPMYIHASSLSSPALDEYSLTPEITKSDLNDLISILHDNNNNISFFLIFFSQFIFSSYNLIFFLVTYVTPMVYMAFCYVKMGKKHRHSFIFVRVIIINKFQEKISGETPLLERSRTVR